MSKITLKQATLNVADKCPHLATTLLAQVIEATGQQDLVPHALNIFPRESSGSHAYRLLMPGAPLMDLLGEIVWEGEGKLTTKGSATTEAQGSVYQRSQYFEDPGGDEEFSVDIDHPEFIDYDVEAKVKWERIAGRLARIHVDPAALMATCEDKVFAKFLASKIEEELIAQMGSGTYLEPLLGDAQDELRDDLSCSNGSIVARPGAVGTSGYASTDVKVLVTDDGFIAKVSFSAKVLLDLDKIDVGPRGRDDY